MRAFRRATTTTAALTACAVSITLVAASHGAATSVPGVVTAPVMHIETAADAAAAAPKTGVGEKLYPNGKWEPRGIVVGPDGALWFTETSGDEASVARITTSGVITRFQDPRMGSNASDIVTGSDHNLWFIINGNSSDGGPQIGRLTPRGALTVFPDPSIPLLFGLVEGPDGAIWYGAGNSVHRMATDGTITTYASPDIRPDAFVVGPDGAIWFGNDFHNYNAVSSIGRITTAGALTTYPVPSILSVDSLAVGPDGAFWFGSHLENGLWRMTTAGKVTSFTGPTMWGPYALAAGSDHALWYTTVNPSVERRTLASGATTAFTSAALSVTYGMVAGPDKAIWFAADSDGNVAGYIGRISTAPVQTTVVASALTGGVKQTVHATVTGLPVHEVKDAHHRVVAVKGKVTLADGHKGTTTFTVALVKGKHGWAGTVHVADRKLRISLTLKLTKLTTANAAGVLATATTTVVKQVAGHAKRVPVVLHLHLTYKPALSA